MTSAHGIPIDDKLAVQTVGPRGLMLLQVCIPIAVHMYTITYMYVQVHPFTCNMDSHTFMYACMIDHGE